MSTVNTSTGYTHFHLHLSRTPCLLPPLTQERIQQTREDFPTDIANALDAIVALKTNIANAHNALLTSKISQAHSANTKRSDKPSYTIGDLIYLLTAHRQREYLNGNNKRVAK
ncbi:hypothetical protein BDR04DRAFT_979139, partial [Suillus decipiens]